MNTNLQKTLALVPFLYSLLFLPYWGRRAWIRKAKQHRKYHRLSLIREAELGEDILIVELIKPLFGRNTVFLWVRLNTRPSLPDSYAKVN